MSPISENFREWYKNPLFAFVSGCAAGATFAYAVLFPAYLGAANLEIAQAREASSRSGADQRKIQELELALASAQKSITDIQHKELFQAGSPYPFGIDQVRVGDTVDVLRSKYPQHSVEERQGYYMMQMKDAVFPLVSYHFGAEKKISFISFSFGLLHELIDPSRKDKFDDEFVHRQLVRALGQPDSSVGRFHHWRLSSGEGVFQDERTSFIIMLKGLQPLAWPSETVTQSLPDPQGRVTREPRPTPPPPSARSPAAR